MKLLWTKSKLPLSLVIRAVTGEDCSHFCFVLYENSVGPIVFESNLLGTHPKFLQTFLKECSVVHQKEIPTAQSDDDKIMDVIISKYDGRSYDFMGAIYLGWRKLLYRLFKLPLPLKNKWDQIGSDFCEEIYKIIMGNKDLPMVNTGMTTPHDLWLKVNNADIH